MFLCCPFSRTVLASLRVWLNEVTSGRSCEGWPSLSSSGTVIPKPIQIQHLFQNPASFHWNAWGLQIYQSSHNSMIIISIRVAFMPIFIFSLITTLPLLTWPACVLTSAWKYDNDYSIGSLENTLSSHAYTLPLEISGYFMNYVIRWKRILLGSRFKIKLMSCTWKQRY